MALWFASLIINLDAVTWDEKIVRGLNFVADHVLQVPLFLMTLMRYITPTLDNLYGNPVPPLRPAFFVFVVIKISTNLEQVHGVTEMG